MYREILRFSFALILCVSCGSEMKDGDGGGGDANGNPPVGTVDDAAGFYVRTLKAERIDFPIHKGLSTFSEDCKADSGSQIDCYVEGEENDLFFQGLTLQYNVPTNMCSYLVYMPYYYYRYQPGTGPTSLRLDIGADGSQGLDNTGGGGDGVIDAPANLTCAYNYTDVDGPNCCTGDYTLVTRTWDVGTNAYTVTSTKSSWGGKTSACLDGPAMATQPLTTSGFPMATMKFVEGEGINDKYEIASPISLRKGTNLYIANYFDPANHGGSSPTAVVRPYFDFQCVDRARELKGQIRVQIRDWDTDAGFQARVTSPTGHSVSGNETWPISGFPLNDYFDWGNLGNTYPQGAD